MEEWGDSDRSILNNSIPEYRFNVEKKIVRKATRPLIPSSRAVVNPNRAIASVWRDENSLAGVERPKLYEENKFFFLCRLY
jgi:hypothetical protein